VGGLVAGDGIAMMDDKRIQTVWRGEQECSKCPIRALALFADLQEKDFTLIHRPIAELRLPRRAAVYHQGEDAAAVFTIRSGLLKLEYTQADGSRRIVRLLRRGDTAGLESLVNQQYRHTAVALQRMSVCRVPSEVVERLNRDTPRICRQLMQRWQKAVDDADAWLTGLSTGAARVRVARFVLYLAESSDDGRFSLVNREDMGSVVGISKESASRVVAEFKRNGLITSLGGGYYTGDISLLAQATVA
jgi:CRP/FNR family transcriptional regulator